MVPLLTPHTNTAIFTHSASFHNPRTKGTLLRYQRIPLHTLGTLHTIQTELATRNQLGTKLTGVTAEHVLLLTGETC